MTKLNFDKTLTEFTGEPVRIPDQQLSQEEQAGLTQQEIKEKQTKKATVEDFIYRLINNYPNPSMRESYLLNKIGEKAAEGGEQEISDREQKLIFKLVENGVEENDVHPRIAMQILEELDEKYISDKLDMEDEG